MTNLKLQIEERLWNYIKRSYLSDNYSTAILDAIQFVGDLIREKSGLDNDGLQLIGGALGGENPKIKLNNLISETDKNFQKGMENIFRGLYSAYRNPRSHSKVEDSEIEAFEVITFVNHLLKIIDKSTGKFSIDLFMRRILDEDFVQTKKYVELLIKDIPKGKYFEITIEMFKSKEIVNIRNSKLIWDSLYSKLSEKQQAELIDLISDELRYSQSTSAITRTIGLLRDSWTKVNEDVRLRSENKLVKLISKSELNMNGKLNDAGSHCTWLKSIVEVSLLKMEIAHNVFESLDSPNKSRQRYVLRHFSSYFEYLEDPSFKESHKDVLKRQIQSGSKIVYDFVKDEYKGKTLEEFKSYLDNFTEPEDDLPF